MITEMICRLSSKGIDAEHMKKDTHKHPTNIMTFFNPRHAYLCLGERDLQDMAAIKYTTDP
jgi:hypothetical protein